MKKRIALLAMVGAVLLFTFGLVAFSVYTVNTVVASNTNTAALDRPVATNAAATTDSQILTDVSSNSADSMEVSVQHIGRECQGDDVGDYEY